MHKKTQGQIRIIGGSHRSRLIRVENQDDLRPTGSRIRETLFNWLGPNLSGWQVLDLFAGSGILGFEALSRGAQAVTFVDSSRRAVKQLHKNTHHLGFDQVTIVHSEALAFLQSNQQCYDLIFLDPPFGNDAITSFNVIMPQLAKPGGFVYREFAKQQQPPPLNTDFFTCSKQKTSGQVNYELWKRYER
ncbi:MAG: 16S rRNA (guanine(966)-N(2))-methyltransferase RsmD [Proteobacteria bacterium]|nr:MAG: 16S rRNA (guanine(966)-N(2))-methyltransferase RsmD [Pseudomonadota bacterium]